MTYKTSEFENETGAMFWAREMKLGNSLFKYVKINEQFRFKESEWFTKTSARWFVDAAGKKFSTGQNSAVFVKEGGGGGGGGTEGGGGGGGGARFRWTTPF